MHAIACEHSPPHTKPPITPVVYLKQQHPKLLSLPGPLTWEVMRENSESRPGSRKGLSCLLPIDHSDDKAQMTSDGRGDLSGTMGAQMKKSVPIPFQLRGDFLVNTFSCIEGDPMALCPHRFR